MLWRSVVLEVPKLLGNFCKSCCEFRHFENLSTSRGARTSKLAVSSEFHFQSCNLLVIHLLFHTHYCCLTRT